MSRPAQRRALAAARALFAAAGDKEKAIEN